MNKQWGIAVVCAVSLVAGCSSSSSGTKVTGDDLYRYFTTENGQSIKDMCGGEPGRWQCYFDHFDTSHSSRVDVYLSTPGGVDTSVVSSDARRWVKNMLTMGDKPPVHPDNIVSFVNGADSGTTSVG